MKTLKYKCTLLSDIILTQNAGTKTQQGTLDFIPGNAFLGIAASKLYGTLSQEESLEMFHSGHVRFGDAHPLSGNIRSLRIPAVYYYKKEKIFSMMEHISCTNGIQVTLSQNSAEADSTPLTMILP